MLIIQNKIIRKSISILLILALILSGFFIAPNQIHALSIEKTVTKYHLDIGVQQVWGTEDKNENILWDDDIGPGENMYNISPSITFSQAVSNVKAYAYSASRFDWDNKEHYSSNVGNEDYYKDNYADYASRSINVTNCSSSGKNVSFSYNAAMNSTDQYDLTKKLNDGRIDQVFRLMAGPNSSDPEGDVKKNFPDLYKKLNAGRNGVDPKVHAYMYFTPVIIQYDVKELVEVGAIDADLNLPVTAKTGESYGVADNSYVEDILSLENAVLEKRIDGGDWQPVTTWEGTGEKGKNTGGSTTEKSEEVCSITYRITITASDGQKDTAQKTITITDGREIKGQAILELDKYTYEGHPADAEDWSEFTVDGVRYSAKRAYEEKIASNRFRTEGGSVKKDGYDAIVTYPKRGTYPVNLEVTIKPTGEKLTDTKNIEVRKTPYVEDHLGGFQKQNRKQILTFNIATYPDKPIVDYDITIKDLKSNEVISLTKAAPQENGACIKTRTVKSEVQDKYWTTLTVEFLTKYPRYDLTGDNSQRFSYKIKVTDSKGDSDEAYKEFEVVPDKPPVPVITMQTAFLRAEGANTAKLEAADGSSSDGDQLERTWSIVNQDPLNNKKIGDFVHAESVDGYEALAFGTNQTIGWNKDGVGKTTVKLHVKDVWNEPTLEEYISPSDYLEAETTAGTEVINIAPVVSIEPLEMLKANLAILVKAGDYDSLLASSNELSAALIEKGFDGRVSFISVREPVESMALKSSVSINDASSSGGTRISDSKYVYVIDPNSQIRALREDGTTAWSYLLENKYDHKLFVDDKEKYLIYCSGSDSADQKPENFTLIFDSKTGALLKRLDGFTFSSSAKLFLSRDGKRLYSADPKGIQRLDFKTGSVSVILSGEIYCPRIEGGKLGFIGKIADAKYYIGKFDLTSEKTNQTNLPDIDYRDPINAEGMSWMRPMDWDTEGRVLVARKLYEDYDGPEGGEAWVLNSRTQTQVHSYNSVGDDRGWEAFLIKDPDGAGRYFGISSSHMGTSKYYNDLTLYKADAENSLAAPLIASSSSGKTGAAKIANMGYLDEETNKIYVFGAENYGRSWIYDLSAGKWEVEYGGLNYVGLDELSGRIETHDGRLVSLYYGNNFSTYPMYYIQQYSLPITSDQATYNGLIRQSGFTGDAENFIINRTGKAAEKVDRYAEEQGVMKLDMGIGEKITALADKIKELGKQASYKLSLAGDGNANLAEVSRNFLLEGNTEYEYSYQEQTASGSAIDAFSVERNPQAMNGKPVYKEVIYRADLTNGANDYITKGFVHFDTGIWFNGSKYGEAGYGGGPSSKNGNSAGPVLSFTMERNGYIQLDMANDCYGYYGRERMLKVDGKLVGIQGDHDPDYGQEKTTFFILLKAGKHTISSEGDREEVHDVIKAIEIGYLSEQDNTFTKQTVAGLSDGKLQTVTNRFTAPKTVAYSEVQSASYPALNLYQLQSTGQLTWSNWPGDNGYYTISGDGKNLYATYTGRISSKGKYTIKFSGNITAPADKMMILYSGRDARILNPGEKYGISYSEQHYDGYPYNRTDTIIEDFYAIEVPVGTLGITTSSAISFGDKSPCIKYTIKNEKDNRFYKIGFSGGAASLTQCQTGYAKEVSGKISLSTKGSGSLTHLLLSDFTLCAVYPKLNAKGMIYENRWNSSLSLMNWQDRSKGTGRAEMEQSEPEKKEEDAPLVYRKGQLVTYKIYYSDYEEDPSRSGYWLYAHTPYNDGAHPEAAILYDEDGHITSICGQNVTPGAVNIDEALSIAKAKGLKTVDKPIDRFYVDGKYTVYHWEVDDTSRGKVVNGYPAYDKGSNTADLTFYVEGGASAPWITGISTSPAKVTENNYFSINVGIDDAEKDILNLTTEVYKDKKLIFTHRKKNIYPIDSLGQTAVNGQHEDGTPAAGTITYPVTNTGALPDKAQTGAYEVVCTVRDQTGAGLGTYRFIVVSEGKITGEVYHTEQWDVNRKKYNINHFKNEINRSIPYLEYMKLNIPRTRGTNIFWSGERFMLTADTAGSPTKVTCSINGTSFSIGMKDSGKKNAAGEAIYTGSLWDKSMISKWGRKEPIELTFTFTASYGGGTTKKHEVKVIVDTMEDYWKLHRAF
ncbi:hypothetical protein [Aminipila luticellarii]|uniref:Uncharacterized protein n=1 Tax=Aminipila luticellarii TaxID=2507160 RepID=A0A410PXZ9_9FIRM|nr:hypothetical protein [Aminipila luticellarii]QAT43833.1 hypothetical protein EQM06_11710 [Aminipila luticellarii]